MREDKPKPRPVPPEVAQASPLQWKDKAWLAEIVYYYGLTPRPKADSTKDEDK